MIPRTRGSLPAEHRWPCWPVGGYSFVSALACSVVALACQTADSVELDAPTGICEESSEGIFLIDLTTKQLIQLVGHHNASGQQNQIKYSYLDNQDGSFDFAFVADRDGDLYHFQARLDAAAIEVTRPERKLEGTESSTLNGPAYCQARGVLGVGDVHPTRVDVQLVSAQSLRTLESSSVSEASAAGFVTPLYEEDGMIAADLNCRDLDDGILFSGLDRNESESVSECIASGRELAAIHHYAADQPSPLRQSFPEADPLVMASPDRPPGNPLGDADPNVLVEGDGGHLMFERVHTTPEVFENQRLPEEFRASFAS